MLVGAMLYEAGIEPWVSTKLLVPIVEGAHKVEASDSSSCLKAPHTLYNLLSRVKAMQKPIGDDEIEVLVPKLEAPYVRFLPADTSDPVVNASGPLQSYGGDVDRPNHGPVPRTKHGILTFPASRIKDVDWSKPGSDRLEMKQQAPRPVSPQADAAAVGVVVSAVHQFCRSTPKLVMR